jgi:hypothetical protein
VPLARLERAAHGLGIRCSIHLSYRGDLITPNIYYFSIDFVNLSCCEI